MSSSIITASYDRQVRFWDPVSGRTIRNLVFADSQINALSVSKDRCRLAVAGHGIIRYYDIASSSQYPPAVATFECSSAGNFTAIGHMPLDSGAGSLLFACSEDGALRILDPRQASMSLLKECTTGVSMTCATLSQDGRLLITGSQIGKVSVWYCKSFIEDAGAGSTISTKPLQELSFPGDHTAIRSISFSPLSNWVAIATNAGKVHCLAFSKDVHHRDGHNVPAASADASPQRSAFLSANSQHQRSLSDAAGQASDNTSVVSGGQPGGTPVREGPTPNGSALDDATTSLSTPANTQAVVTKPPSMLLSKEQKEWFLECVQTMTCHYKYILKVAISPDGKLLATCCADYTIGLWTIPKLLARPTEVEDMLKSPAASPKASEAAATEVTSPAPLASTAPLPPALSPKVSMSSMSPQRDAASLAAASVASPPVGAKLANPYEFAALKPLQGHTRWVWDCAFSPCSTVLVTVSSDNHVRVWSNVHTDKPKSDIFVGHTKPVVCVLLDVDRTRVGET